MTAAAPIPAPGIPVTAADIAANLRIISVRLESISQNRAVLEDLLGRIDTIVRLFLEKHWVPPRRIMVIQPLSYVLFQGFNDPNFAEDVEDLRAELERKLFGEGELSAVEFKSLLGPRVAIEQIAQRTQEAFLTAHAEAERAAEEADVVYLDIADDEEEAPPKPAPKPRPRKPAPVEPLTAGDTWRNRIRLYAGFDAPKKAVVCYLATLSAQRVGASSVLYEDFTAESGADATAFEITTLRFVVKKIMERAQNGPVGYCLTPLSYETLADRRRREAYVAAASQLPEPVRRYIVPSIFGGPPGPSSSFLMDVFGAVRASFKLLDWRTRTCVIDTDSFQHVGLFAITLVPPTHGRDREIEMARLPDLVRKLAPFKVRTGAAGLNNQLEVETALAAGAHFLTGPAVSSALSEPEPRTHVERTDFPLHD